MDSDLYYQSINNLVYVATVAIFTLAIVLETLAPRRPATMNVVSRWANNFGLGLLTWFTSLLTGTAFVVWLASWTNLHGIGLLRQFPMGPLASFFIMLLVTQLLNYWVHRAFHRFSWLWPIHAVHHTDVDVDVSTAYRHHPLEPLVSLPLMMPVVLSLGVPVEAALAYRLFEVAATVFSHSNIRVPAPLERYLRFALLTPDFHRIHHCSQPRYTNSNYGSLVPWFDYLFGTARTRHYDEQETMELGLQYLRAPADTRLDRQLLAPLVVNREQRLLASQTTSST